jgi:hypothetical protein
MTPDAANARQQPSASLEARTLATSRATEDRASITGACAARSGDVLASGRSSETAVALLHSASPAGVFPTADAMTAATANACHGSSVSLEAMATGDGLALDPATDWRPATDWQRTGRATCWRRTGARPLASSRPPTQ